MTTPVYLNDPEIHYYDYHNNPIVAHVKYNERLDYWDGNNNTNGGMGMHKGMTKLRKPYDPERPYVIIIGSQWQGSKNYGYCVTKEEAIHEILAAGCSEDDWLSKELKEEIKAMEENESNEV